MIEPVSRPIIFSAWSIPRILDGSKTMTRRVIKPQPVPVEPRWSARNGLLRFNEGKKNWQEANVDWLDLWATSPETSCPYGRPGDLLYVKETWFPMQDVQSCAVYREPVEIIYKADWDADGVSREEARDIGVDKWRSPLFMPRWASRIALEILNVKVERVSDITDSDAIAEGIKMGAYRSERLAFANLWDTLHAKPKPVRRNKIISHYINYPFEGETETREFRGKPWYVVPSPWVWVLEFRLMEKDN